MDFWSGREANKEWKQQCGALRGSKEKSSRCSPSDILRIMLIGEIILERIEDEMVQVPPPETVVLEVQLIT